MKIIFVMEDVGIIIINENVFVNQKNNLINENVIINYYKNIFHYLIIL